MIFVFDSMRVTSLAVVLAVVVLGSTACRRAPRGEESTTLGKATESAPKTAPLPVPSAAPGEEIGLFLESYAPGNSTGISFYWPNDAFRPCRLLAQKSVPPQLGFVEMTLRIDDGGVVTKVVVLGSEGLDSKVVECVSDAGRHSKFSEPDGGEGSIYAYVALR